MRKKRLSKADSFYDTYESPVGTLYLVFTGENLRELSYKKPEEIRRGKTIPLIKRELREYFEIGKEEFTQKVGFTEGTDFEKKVWVALKDIPYGETRTYKWLAEKVGNPNACRAVGQALSRNPIPIIFPCHRIVESDGSIGGYNSGVDIKRRLLEIEYYIKLAKKK